MFRTLLLENFQVWERLLIQFGERATVLIGPSDTGKSACIRALRWVCQNTPAGDAFVRHGSKLCRVTLGVDDHVIARERGKGVNRYLLDGEVYDAPGMGKVPDPIAKLLNIHDHNFQSQMDPPFWLSLTSGEAARELNSVVDLTLIDRVLDKAGSRVRSCSSTLQVCEGRLEDTHKRITELDWVEASEAALNALELKERTLAKNRTECDSLASLLASAKSLREQHRHAVAAGVAAKLLLQAVNRAREHDLRTKELQNLLLELRKQCRERDRLLENCTAIRQKLAESGPLVCSQCGQTVPMPGRSL